jgi:hypothetical protein
MNSFRDVQLQLPYNNPCTLYYYLGNPGIYRMVGAAGPMIFVLTEFHYLHQKYQNRTENQQCREVFTYVKTPNGV